ncbi:MAG: 3-dehydroquinate synthase family protein, partial [Verrucomicrobiota bacterium]
MATLHTEEDGTLRLTVELADDPYDVSIGDGVRSRVGSVLRERFPTAKSVVVVTDSTVGPLYAKEVTDSLSAADFLVHALETPAGESSKSMDEVTRICRAMLQMGCDRKSLLVALGGGVVGDLAGFCASIFQRGIPYLQMPTTIVSQVDSSVGGKTGVNTAEGKNLLGAFHQPCHVLADTETLRSLPPREYREGFAEVIKHAAIRNGELLAELSKFSSDSHGIAPLIAENVRIKATIVEEDERETSGTRALLNFGHTIGHGIEAAAG